LKSPWRFPIAIQTSKLVFLANRKAPLFPKLRFVNFASLRFQAEIKETDFFALILLRFSDEWLTFGLSTVCCLPWPGVALAKTAAFLFVFFS